MVLAAAWAFLLCFVILADIIFRALNMPLQGTKEIVANSVVMIVFLQLGFAIRSRSMLQADFLVHLFGERLQTHAACRRLPPGRLSFSPVSEGRY